MKVYSEDEDDCLRILVAKADVWSYEREYRLVAQERSAAAPRSYTLMTDDNLLQLPEGALTAVIMGCQGDHEKIGALVQETSPEVTVKRAMRVPNRYELRIEG